MTYQDIQFAGGFDYETIQAFQELKKVGCVVVVVPSNSNHMMINSPKFVKIGQKYAS